MSKKKKSGRRVFGNPASRQTLGSVSVRAISRADLDNGMFANGLSRAIRSNCDACGSPVRWVTPDEALAHGMGVREVSEAFGVSVNDLDIWLCPVCPKQGGVFPRG